MAFKQPRVPEYREREGVDRYIRSLILFLKDFCMDVWTANNQRSGEIDAVKGGLAGIHYPVSSVCGKTGDVALTAGDVGALEKNGTAANSGKLGGKTWAQLMLAIYPVGAIYLSAVSTSPASLFGGTWEQMKDRFLLGAGSGYAAGATGGAATVNITPKGTNAGTAITAAQMPKHRHQTRIWNNGGTKGPAKTTTNYGAGVTNATYGAMYGNGDWQNNTTFNVAQNGYGDQNGITDIAGNGATHTHTFSGTTQSVDNMPPYLAVYMWKRVS